MGSKIFDMPRHQRPMWEVLAFVAALAGLIGLAVTRVTVDRAIVAKPAGEAPATAAGYSE